MLSQSDLDAMLVRKDQSAPFNRATLKQLCGELLRRYEDPADHVVKDGYLWDTFVQALHGNPDAVKLAARDPLAGEFVSKSMYARMSNMDSLGGGNMPIETKAALSTAVTGADAGGTFINQSVIPQVYVWFNTNFRILREFPYDPARGLDYEWNSLVSIGTSTNLGWIGEHGQPVDSNPVAFRGRANVGLQAASRRHTLRLEAAIAAGGVLYNVEGADAQMNADDLQLYTATIQNARDAEITFFQGTTASGHTGADEFGISCPDGFNGLRVQLSGNANAVNAGEYPAGYFPNIFEVNPASATITGGIRSLLGAVRNFGANQPMIIMTETMAGRIAAEMYPQFRYTYPNGDTGVVAGAPNVTAIEHPAFGRVPIFTVLDSSIGQYPATSIGTPTINGTPLAATTLTGTVEDIYVVDRVTVKRTGYGPDGLPVPMEIPMGLAMFPDGTDFFARRQVIYQFLGVAVTVPVRGGKVRVKVA